MITVPFSPFSLFNDAELPVFVSGSRKSLALLPKGIITEGVLAITQIIG